MSVLKRIPLPLSGIALALFSLGNLYKESAPGLRGSLGVIATLLLALVVLKIAFAREATAEELKNPVVVSVLPTISMALLISATYLVTFSQTLAAIVWWFALALHLFFMVFFIRRVLIPFDVKKIFASLFIPFVGIVCASVSSPAVGQTAVGRAIFWFGLAAFIICLPIALMCVLGKTPMPEPAKPTSMIFAAPASLLIAGYLSAFEAKSATLLIILGIVAVLLIVLALVLVAKTVAGAFTPSFAAFTFPMVISTIAMTGLGAFLTNASLSCPAFPALPLVLRALAWIAVIYAIARYAIYLLTPAE